MTRKAAGRPPEPDRPHPDDTVWWATLRRDDFKCRIAPFYPDMPCEGELEAYAPTGNPEEHAVTACERHLDWMARHPHQAKALGLTTDIIEVTIIPRDRSGMAD